MSFRIYSKIKSIFLVFALGFLFVSCAQKENFDTAVGYLYAPQLDVDVVVEDMMATKASTDAPDVSADAPEVSQIRFVVKDKDGNVKHDALGLWTEALVLPVGKYTITATYGSNTFDAPYFTASVEGTIEALDEEMPEIQMELGNSMVMVNIADALAQHFQGTASVKVSNKESAIENIELGKWYYVPSGEDLTITLAGTNAAGTPTTLDHTLPAPQAKNAYRVECSTGGTTNLPQISLPDQQSGAWNTRLYITPATIEGGAISEENKAKLVYEVSASADFADAVTATNISGDYYYVGGLTNGSTYYVRARIGSAIVSYVHTVTIKENLDGATVEFKHTKDASENLDGTEATLSVAFEGIVKTLIDAGHLQIGNFTLTKGSTIVRTASASGLMNVSEGWPYLPQGALYNLVVEHRLVGEQTYLTSIKSAPSVPAPVFTVKLGQSYTSYDEATGSNGISKNVANANTRNAETIYAVSASGGVSESLMTNANYSKTTLTVSLAGTDKTPSGTVISCNIGNITGLTDWKSYELAASMTFDNVTVTDTKTHQITGLPYSYDFYTSKSDGTGATPKWTASGIRWTNNKMTISYDGSDGYLISPQFNYEGNVTYRVEAQYYQMGAYSATINMYVGATVVGNIASTYDTHAIKYNTNTGNNHSPYTGDLNISSTSPCVSIHHNKNNVRLAVDYFCIYEFHLQYK